MSTSIQSVGVSNLSKSSIGPDTGTIIESNLSGESKVLGIANTPEMFAILSKRMYSYQIRAIIRETCCNARDSHLEYGCLDEPIEVKLPTRLDPVFYVQDRGIGISDHNMLAIYMIYGQSTKREDMRTTGGFGLGCKSPYAYLMEHRDQNSGFTVTSTRDGVRVIYYFHLSAQGLPSHVKVAELVRPPEGWEDGVDHGVRVSMSVRLEDVNAFVEEAKYVFKHFDVKPKIVGASVELHDETYLLESESFGIRGRNPAVVMGCVEYPLTERYTPKNDIERAFINAGIVLKLPVGAVMMTPSREQLEYVAHTFEGLDVGFKQAAKEFTLKMREQILDNYDKMTPWEWRCHVRKLYLAMPDSIRRLIVSAPLLTAICEGSDIDVASLSKTLTEGHVELTVSIGAGKLPVHKVVYKRDANNNIERDDDGAMIIASQSVTYRAHVARFAPRTNGRGSSVQKQEVLDGKLILRDKRESIYLTLGSDLGIFVADSTYADQRVREWVDSGAHRVAYLFSPQKGGTVEEAMAEALLMIHQPELQGLTVRQTSDIPFTPVQRAKAVRIDSSVPWHEQVSDIELPQLVVGANDVSELFASSPLADVEEDGQFYLICDHSIMDLTQSGRRRFWCIDPADESIMAMTSHISRLVSAMKLLDIVKAPITSVVLVDSVPQLRRLKLVENGFQPLWPWFVKWFKENVLESLEKSAKLITSFENVDADYLRYNKDDLLWAVLFDNKLFDSLVAVLGQDHLFIKDVVDIKTRITTNYDDAIQDPDQVLRELASDVFKYGLSVSSSKLSLPESSKVHISSYSMQDSFNRNWRYIYNLCARGITQPILEQQDPVLFDKMVKHLAHGIQLAVDSGSAQKITYAHLN